MSRNGNEKRQSQEMEEIERKERRREEKRERKKRETERQDESTSKVMGNEEESRGELTKNVNPGEGLRNAEGRIVTQWTQWNGWIRSTTSPCTRPQSSE